MRPGQGRYRSSHRHTRNVPHCYKSPRTVAASVGSAQTPHVLVETVIQQQRDRLLKPDTSSSSSGTRRLLQARLLPSRRTPFRQSRLHFSSCEWPEESVDACSGCACMYCDPSVASYNLGNMHTLSPVSGLHWHKPCTCQGFRRSN